MTNQRKTNIIKKRFQNELILKTVLTTFITFNFILVIAYFMTGSVFSSSLSAQTFMQYIAGLEVIAAVFIYMISRRFSFHIAGPVYAVERSLKAMTEGDLTISLQLRKKDNFEEVSDVLNETLDTYREQIAGVKQQFNQIKAQAELNPSILSELDKLEQQLNFFKVEKEESVEK